MRKELLVILILISLLLPAASTGATARARAAAITPQDDAQKSSQIDFVPGNVLVRFRPGSALAERGAGVRALLALRAPGGREIPAEAVEAEGFQAVEGLRVAHVAPEDTLEAVAALRARPDVLYAEPDYVRRRDAAPNDPRYAEMWALKNTGQSGGTAGADIRAEAAWDVTTGSRQVVVGIVDEGVDITHPDLQPNVWTNPGEVPGNGLDDDGDGFIDDVHGWDFFHNDASVYDGSPSDNDTDAHGTHVAGTVGAAGDNGAGVVGVNWQVGLMPLKVLGAADESSAPSSVSTTIRAYGYAKMMRDLWVSSGGARGANVRVLNNSYGGSGHSQAESDAIRALADSQILFVASAGNDGHDVDHYQSYPAGYDLPNVISVAATERHDSLAAFSNYGPRTVALGAPGSQILSTTPNATYNTFSGTSMAAPHVAGAAALVCAAHPQISAARLRAALLFSGDELPALAGKTITGRRLNAAAALQNAGLGDSTPPAAATGLRVASQSGRSITLQWTAPGDDGDAGRAALYELRFADGDLSAPAQFAAGYKLVAPATAPAGTTQTATVQVPYRHTSGFIGLRAIDKAGNAGPVSQVVVAVDAAAADPYVVTESGPGPLSTGGDRFFLNGDDKMDQFYQLPFAFPFFGEMRDHVAISTNGVLYFSDPPLRPGGDADDAGSSLDGLNRLPMIAGLWDDLRTDRRAGDDVYVVKPDDSRVIFRWQAVTFDTPLGAGATRGENPVSFEVELRRDGTIQVRYGEGNTRLFPVVGISGGDPDAYAVLSHTSTDSLKDLTDAPAVTFALRNPPAPPPPLPKTNGKIAFQTNRDGNDEIYSMNADGSGQTRLTTNPGPDQSPAWSPDGTRIAFTSSPDFNNSPQIVLMNADGTGRVNVTNNGVLNADPAWSPDGQKIAFASFRDTGNKPQIYVVNADGSNTTRLTNDTSNDGKPTWSPDGTRLAFVSDRDGSGFFKLYLMNADGTGQQKLLDDVAATPAWSPDGTRIAYSSFGDIFVVNADGTGRVRLTFNTSSQEVNPAWSPDGTKILFASNPNVFWNIFVMNADGSSQVDITNNQTHSMSPSWQTQPSAPPPPANAIDGSDFFVRQHYADFLNRAPDSSGLQFWTNNIESCGADMNCRAVKRVDTSAAFFLSIEFKETGYLVYLMHKAAFGNLPGKPVPVTRAVFLPDTQAVGQGVVVGQTGWEAQLENNKNAFALAFVQRAAFQSAYPSTMTADEFVAKLDQNAGGVLSAAEKSSLAAALGPTPSDASKRAQVLRAVAENQAFRQRESDHAFVLMQYFGYLQRDPDAAPDADFTGYNFWLSKLDSFGGNYVQAQMVQAFISSTEYRKRFGP
jgi:Tol biopolymer transport system component/subtilisin family serine protease